MYRKNGNAFPLFVINKQKSLKITQSGILSGYFQKGYFLFTSQFCHLPQAIRFTDQTSIFIASKLDNTYNITKLSPDIYHQKALFLLRILFGSCFQHLPPNGRNFSPHKEARSPSRTNSLPFPCKKLAYLLKHDYLCCSRCHLEQQR